MTSLILTIGLLLVVFLVQKGNPFLAGIVAVIPIKILGTALITHETGGIEHLSSAIKGMLIGQFFWGFVLLGLYFYLRQ